MLSALRKVAIASALVVALLTVWVVLLSRWVESVAPGGETLAACLVKMPAPLRAEVFAQDGQEYLLLRGRTRSFPRFPSGPPMYLFDRTGKLVDWVGDSGDAPAWWNRWPGAANGREIDRDELMRWPGATQ